MRSLARAGKTLEALKRYRELNGATLDEPRAAIAKPRRRDRGRLRRLDLAACQHRAVSDSNVELVRRGWEAAHRGDLKVIAELLDPEVKWHGGDPTAEGSCQNRSQALEWMRRARRGRALPELVDVVGGGDRVVVVMARPTDRGGTELVANVSTFRDGKVIEMVHYPDANDALAAVGA